MYKLCLLLLLVSSPLHPMLSIITSYAKHLQPVAALSVGVVAQQKRAFSDCDLLHEHIQNKDYISFEHLVKSGTDLNLCAKPILGRVAELPFGSLKLLLEYGIEISRVERRSYTLLNTFAQHLRFGNKKICRPIEAVREQLQFSSDEQSQILKKVMLLAFNGAIIDMSRDFRAQKPWGEMHPFINPNILPDVVTFLSKFKVVSSRMASDERKNAAVDEILSIMERNGIELKDFIISRDVETSRIQE